VAVPEIGVGLLLEPPELLAPPQPNRPPATTKYSAMKSAIPRHRRRGKIPKNSAASTSPDCLDDMLRKANALAAVVETVRVLEELPVTDGCAGLKNRLAD